MACPLTTYDLTPFCKGRGYDPPYAGQGDANRRSSDNQSLTANNSFPPRGAMVNPIPGITSRGEETMTIRTDRRPADLPAETEPTVSSARLCNTCKAPLTDRRPQARFCSDRCRVRHRRDVSQRRRLDLLDVMAVAVAQLRADLGCDDD